MYSFFTHIATSTESTFIPRFPLQNLKAGSPQSTLLYRTTQWGWGPPLSQNQYLSILRHPEFGLPEIVHTQNIWGTMAHRDRDLGHSRSFPTGALITRSGLAAPGALDPDISR